MLTFIISGLWHGANWTFLIWGWLHGIYYVANIYLSNTFKSFAKPDRPSSSLAALSTFIQTGITFLLTTLAWIFFRADNITIAIEYITRIFTRSFFYRNIFAFDSSSHVTQVDNHLWSIFLLLSLEWLQRNKAHPLQFTKMPIAGRWLVYLLITLFIIDSLAQPQTFIYFQF